MSHDKNEKPSVATFADHEIITPPNKLRKALSTAKDSADDPVARAEQALAKLSSEFRVWMNDECDRLDAARREAKVRGFTKDTCEALFHAVHDIKGGSATFGFPAVAAPADSLCRLIDHTPDMTRIPMTLVDQHVDAIRAIIRESARPDVEQIATTLTERLCEVTEEFLRHENHDLPERMPAPPLVPGGNGS